jgi:hypothetical protein
VVAVLAAAATRSRSVPTDLAAVWLVTATAVAVVGCRLAISDQIAERTTRVTVATVLFALAIAAGVSARVLHRSLRYVAAVLFTGSWFLAGVAAELSAPTTVMMGTSLAVVAIVGGLARRAASGTSPWIGPAFVVGAVAQTVAAGVALEALPRRDLLVTVLLAAAVESAALGAVLRLTPLVAAAPLLACAAWLVFAGGTLDDLNWFTVPLGVAVLVSVGLIRWLRRQRGEPVATTDIVVLDVLGMTFTVAVALARVLDGALWYGLLAIWIGIALTVWGLMTRVRRRVAFGAGSVVVAVVLLVGVPLAGVVPTWHGPALWIAVAAIGLAAIVTATLLEQGRAAVRRVAAEVREHTSEWE